MSHSVVPRLSLPQPPRLRATQPLAARHSATSHWLRATQCPRPSNCEPAVPSRTWSREPPRPPHCNRRAAIYGGGSRPYGPETLTRPAGHGRHSESASDVPVQPTCARVCAPARFPAPRNDHGSRDPRNDSRSRGPRDSEGRGPRDSEGRGPRDSEGRGPRDSEGRGPRDSEGRGPRDSEGRDPRDSGGRLTRDVVKYGAEDAGAEDAGAEDAGAEDAGAEDAGAEDAGAEDAGAECTSI
jgi:hypothetical protein